jgi:hypothetical protein
MELGPHSLELLSRPHAVSVALEEYRSVRQESLTALAAQQTILTWSVAAIAVIFAAGVGYTKFDSPTDSIVAWCLVFGLALPGGIFAATLSWLGEVIRMERAGGYLRVRERQIIEYYEAVEASNEGPSIRPLGWELRLSDPETGDYTKSAIGYLGACGLFFGTFFVGVGLYAWAVLQHHFQSHRLFAITGLFAIDALLSSGYVVVVCRTMLKVRARSRV